MRNLNILVSGLIITLLTACGGGGSDGSTVAAAPVAALPATTNVLAAYTANFRTTRTLSLSGSTSTGLSFTATLSNAPGSQVSSEAGVFDSFTSTVSIFRGGTLAASGVTTYWMSPGSPYPTYQFDSADGSCIGSRSITALPTSAILNQSGPYLAGSEYSQCSSSNLPRTIFGIDFSVAEVTQTWSYQAIGGVPYVCINSSWNHRFGGTSIESNCIEVLDSSGTLGGRVRITATDLNGVTITLSN